MAGKWLAFVIGIIAGPYTELKLQKCMRKGTSSPNDKTCGESAMVWKAFQEYDNFSAHTYSQPHTPTAPVPATAIL